MNGFRDEVKPGMALVELHALAGSPSRILDSIESIGTYSRTIRLERFEEGMTIHVYQEEGLPYFNVYVVVDENRRVVTECHVVPLGG